MENIAHIIEAVLTIIGALGSIATLLSHLPFVGANAQAWFARFGMATSKFRVESKDPPGKSESVAQ